MSLYNVEFVAQALLGQMDAERATKSRIQAAADALVASGTVPKRVIIEVDGGVARVAYVSPGVEVQIIDHDDESDGLSPIEPAPAWCAHGVHYDRPCERCS